MNLSPIVTKTIPEFVNDDYPLFVQFLKTYYKWLDATQINSIENVVDIDTTLDSFIKYFRQELDVFGIKYQYVDERIYLKHVKQFFLAKGSEAAYWFLFRILFNSDSAILRPWDSVFIPSNGKWVQDITIFIRVDKGDGNNFKQNSVIIIGDDGKEYYGRVVDVVEVNYNVFELYLDKILTGNIAIGNIVISEDKKTKGRLLSTITKIAIQSPGRKFNVGEVYDIVTQNGYGSKFIVREIDENGGLTKVELLSFGLGYEHQFMQVIYPVTVDERILPDSNITIINTEGYNYTYTYTNHLTLSGSSTQFNLDYGINYFLENYIKLGFTQTNTDITPVDVNEQIDLIQSLNPIVFNFNSGDVANNISDFGEIVKHNYGATPVDYFTDLTYVGRKVGQFNNTLASETKTFDAATLFCYTDYIVRYPGYYSDLYGILGQKLYIQDSYYYQIYSYVTSVDKSFKTYHTLINNIIHPIGNKVFGNYTPTNETTLSLSINNELRINYPDNIFVDPIIINDAIVYNFGCVLDDLSVEVSDSRVTILNGVVSLDIDSVTASITTPIRTIIKVISDSFQQPDEFNYTRIYLDSVIITEDPTVFAYNKIVPNYQFNISDNCTHSRVLGREFEENVISSDDETNGGSVRIEEGLIIADTVITTEDTITFDTILKEDDTFTMQETISIYYGELYVDQTPPYWDTTYYEKELII